MGLLRLLSLIFDALDSNAIKESFYDIHVYNSKEDYNLYFKDLPERAGRDIIFSFTCDEWDIVEIKEKNRFVRK